MFFFKYTSTGFKKTFPKLFLLIFLISAFSLYAREFTSFDIYDAQGEGEYACDVKFEAGVEGDSHVLYFAWSTTGDKGENIEDWSNILRLGYVGIEATKKTFNLPPPVNEAIAAHQLTFASRVFLASSNLDYDYFTDGTKGVGSSHSYIHTDFKPQEGKTIISVDCIYPSIDSDVYLFGCYNDKYSMACYFNNSKEWAFACNDDYTSFKSTGYTGVANERVVVTLDATGLSATTGTVTVVETGEKYLAINEDPHVKSGSATSYNNLFLLGRSQGGNVNKKASTATIYSCVITNNGVCVRDYRPAIKDGIAGFWDAVNNVFYKSAGSTQLASVGTNKTYFVGAGDIQESVSTSWKVPVVSEYKWTGSAGDGLLTTPGNWEGNVAPDFSDGLAQLVLNGGSEEIIVSGELAVYGIVFDSTSDVSLKKGNENAKIILGRGGVTTKNTEGTETITYTIAVPVEISVGPQAWEVASLTILDLQSPISTIGFEEYDFTISSPGQIKFNAGNPDFTSPLFITDVTEAGRPVVYKSTGLGSPNRTVTFRGEVPPLFDNSTGVITNEAPLVIPSPENFPLNLSKNYPLHFMNLVTVSGGYVSVLKENTVQVYFHGGIKNTSGTVTCYMDSHVTIEDTLISPNIIYFVGQRNIYLATTNCSYNNLNPYRANVICMTNNVFDKTATIEMGTSGGYYRKAGATLDLNGFDQEIKYLKRGWNYNEKMSGQGDGYSTVHSAVPATLEVKSDITPSGNTASRAPTYMCTAFRFTGAAGFHFSGTGVFGFTNHTSTTVGELRVSNGTVNIWKGGGWTATTNVIVEGTGTLNVRAGTGDTAFGPAARDSACELVMADDGVLSVEEGETATVKYFFIRSESGYLRPMQPGVYGGTDSDAGDGYRLECFSGAGKIRVLNQLGGGLKIFIR